VGTVKNKLNEWRRGRQGFTLVELLVVIAIIGVLATLVLLQLGAARARARDTKRIADINQVRSAIELYFEDQGGVYPTDIYADVNAGGLDKSQYIVRVPLDPLTEATYGYCYSNTGRSYQVWAELEQRAVGALNGDADIELGDFTADGASAACIGGGGNQLLNELCDSPATCIYDLGTVFD